MSNKVAVITGGSSGIGKATAEYFAEQEYEVYELSRSGKGGKDIIHITADVTDEKSLKDALDQIFTKSGRIDVFVNNAGFGISGAVEHTPIETAKKQFDVNFFGMASATRLALPYVKVKSGIIINVSSVAATLAIPFQAYYSAAKAAINAFTAALALEVKPFGVRVTALMPGDIATGFTAVREKIDGEGYGERITRSVAQMEKDEINGMKPKFIAEQIFKLSLIKNPRPLYTAGIKYRFFVWLSKFLPSRLVAKILGAMYAK